MKSKVIELKNVGKIYKKGVNDVVVLDALNMTVEQGEFVAIMGPSGSGKTTLLNILGGIEAATCGEVKISGQSISGMKDNAVSKWRAQNIGIIFQSYNLMQYLTARENIRLPLLLTKFTNRQQEERVDIALDLVGLSDKATFYPRELSGGQEQRVAIARAIVSDPQVILCDEPTGDLDRKTADEILLLLKNLCEQEKKTIVMVTHDSVAADYAHRVYHMEKDSLGHKTEAKTQNSSSRVSEVV